MTDNIRVAEKFVSFTSQLVFHSWKLIWWKIWWKCIVGRKEGFWVSWKLWISAVGLFSVRVMPGSPRVRRTLFRFLPKLLPRPSSSCILWTRLSKVPVLSLLLVETRMMSWLWCRRATKPFQTFYPGFLLLQLAFALLSSFRERLLNVSPTRCPLPLLPFDTM